MHNLSPRPSALARNKRIINVPNYHGMPECRINTSNAPSLNVASINPTHYHHGMPWEGKANAWQANGRQMPGKANSTQTSTSTRTLGKGR